MGKIITKITAIKASVSAKESDVLDAAIRRSETKEDKSDFGYEINGYFYLNYMGNAEWEKFKKTIPERHLKSFKGEMKGNPPHMASYGSSSRFIWNTLHSIEDIEFEKNLPTYIGNSAHLDACSENRVFVEAKCHEIYNNNHKGCEAYREVYNYIAQRYPEFKCDNSLKFFIGDNHIGHFDLKQLICHFLAIAGGILARKTESNARFVYMIYNPEGVREHIEAIGEEHWPNISRAYEDTLAEIRSIDTKRLFEIILGFQKNNPRVEKNYCGEYSFEFHIADQDSWEEHFK